MTPFLYVRRHQAADPGPEGGYYHSAFVMSANLGFGHRHEPCLHEFKGYRDKQGMETALQRWAKTLDPSVQVCLDEADYLALMAERNIGRQQEAAVGVV